MTMNVYEQPVLNKRNLKARPNKTRHRAQFYWDAVKREIYDCARHILLVAFNAAGEFSLHLFKKACYASARRVSGRRWRGVLPALVLFSNIASMIADLDAIQYEDYDPVKGYPSWLDDLKFHFKKGA